MGNGSRTEVFEHDNKPLETADNKTQAAARRAGRGHDEHERHRGERRRNAWDWTPGFAARRFQGLTGFQTAVLDADPTDRKAAITVLPKAFQAGGITARLERPLVEGRCYASQLKVCVL